MGSMTVEHTGGDRFTVAIRGHQIVVDQPGELGGTDEGPTPTELFVAGLPACVAFFGRRFLARHGLPEGIRVTTEYALSSDRPARVGEVRLLVETEGPVPPERQAAFQRVLEHCTVHNTLREPPEVTIAVAVSERV
jgi:putative redox protein